jgi:hypothetical protein
MNETTHPPAPRKVLLANAAIVTMITTALCVYFATNFVHAQMQARVLAITAQRDLAQHRLEAVANVYTTLDGKETVLYEPVPVGVDVLHGLGRVEAGRALSGMAIERPAPRWVIPYAVQPKSLSATTQDFYAYHDKRTGALSAMIPAAHVGER